MAETIEVFNEAGERHQLKLFPSEVVPPPDDAEVAQVLIQRVRLGRTRQLGPALLGAGALAPAATGRILRCPPGRRAGRRHVVACRRGLAVNRLCAPVSELAIEERWYPTTALDDLLTFPTGR